MKAELAILLAGGAALASAQQTQWGQCGGIGWTGPTTCVSGSTCTYSNAYYSQCLPGAAGTTTKATTTAAATRTTTTSSTTSVRTTAVISTTVRTTTTSTTTSSKAATTTSTGTTKFQYFGTNESGGEFGNTAIPGQLGKDYTWPSPSSIDYFVSNGFNTFRVGTMMERIAPPSTGGVTGSFNETYMSGLDTIVNYITGKGAYAIIDVHNYGRYQGNIITSTSDFQTFWTHLAARYKSNSKVIFDTNNEYHDMDETLVFGLNQAAINGIRAAGATSQLILVEGNSYTGAWTWISSGNAASLINLTDPNNNFAYEMHQYLDSDGSGTSATCVSSTIFAERISAATNWCKTNNVKCFLGEIGAGTDSVCQAALRGGFTAMQASGAWIGVTWWAAGPWWGTYYQSIEPNSGPANAVIVPLLKSFQ